MVPPGGRDYKIHTKQADTSWLFVSFLSLFLIQVWSNYNVVLITAIHKVTRLYILFHVLSHHGLSRILNRVPCAVQWDLAVYLFHIYQFASANPNSHPRRLGSHQSAL